MYRKLRSLFNVDGWKNIHFGPPIAKFEIKVSGPKGGSYDHQQQVDLSIERLRNVNLLRSVHPCFNSENFSKTSHILKEGEIYEARIFPVLNKTSSRECLDFLRKRGAIPPGAQGLTLVLEQSLDELPINIWLVSPDEKDMLPNEKILGIWERKVSPRGRLTFDTKTGRLVVTLRCVSFESGLSPYRALLAFFKK